MPHCLQRLGIVSSNNDYNIYIMNKGYTKHMILSIFRSIKYLTLKMCNISNIGNKVRLIFMI